MLIILEWILILLVIFSSILGILIILLQGSQNTRGLFEDSGSNLFSNTKGNWITRLTGILIATFLISSLSYAYIQTLVNTVPEVKEKPSFIQTETLQENLKSIDDTTSTSNETTSEALEEKKSEDTQANLDQHKSEKNLNNQSNSKDENKNLNTNTN